jgi:hypothetical protein
MHLDGLLRRQKKPMRVMHVAEIIAGAMNEEMQNAKCSMQNAK